MKDGAGAVKAKMRRIALLAAIGALVAAACGSDRDGLPGLGPSTTAHATSTTTVAATGTSSPVTIHTAPTLEPNVVAATASRKPSLSRIDLPLTLNAPATLVAASPTVVVAMGWRGVGCCRVETSAAFSNDGRQFRSVETPWTFDEATNTFGRPAALAFADGVFLSVGLRGKADATASMSPIAVRSTDGITWQAVDLQATIGSASPTHLTRYGDRWVLMAQPTDTSPARQTVVFASTDSVVWEQVAQLDFAVLHVASSSLGIVAAGTIGNGETARWFSAVSRDTGRWDTTQLALAPMSPVHALLVDSVRAVLVVSEDITPVSNERRLIQRRIRLLSSSDGVRWQGAPTPPCFVVGENAVGATASNGTWAIVSGEPTPKLATSNDEGASWSCTELRGGTFESQPSWGPPYLAQLTDVQGKLALVGGRLIEPGAKGNWAAAIWYAT